MIDDYDFILRMKTYIQNGRVEVWVRVLFVVSFTSSTFLPTTGTVPTFMRIQWKQRVLCSIRVSEWMPARMPPMLLADVKIMTTALLTPTIQENEQNSTESRHGSYKARKETSVNRSEKCTKANGVLHRRSQPTPPGCSSPERSL